MMTEAQIEKKKLRDWFRTIPPCDLQKVFSMVCEECMVAPSRLYSWRYSKSRIPLSGKRDLNKVALRYRGEKIFDEVGPDVAVEA